MNSKNASEIEYNMMIIIVVGCGPSLPLESKTNNRPRCEHTKQDRVTTMATVDQLK